MNIQLVILIVYVVLLLVIAAWATKLQKSGAASGNRMLGYLLAGRNMPWILVAVLLVGLAVGAASTVGVSQLAYKMGLSAGWYNGAWGLGGIFVGLFAAKNLRKMKVKTIPEMIGLMYGPKTRFVGVINQMLVLISITAMQYVAGGAILRALLPNIFPSLQAGMIASAVIFIAITVIGGYWASGLTNLINVIVIYIGIIVALIQTLGMYGGFDSIRSAFPGDGHWFDWVGSTAQGAMGSAAVIGQVAVMITMAVSTQAVAQIAFAARDEKTAKKGFLVGGILILPVGFLCAIFGMVAAANADVLGLVAAKDPGAIALPTIATKLNPFVGGIFLAALWAADVSTAVALLMGCSTLVVEDIVKKIYRKPIQGKNQMLVSRLTVFFVSVLAFLLALTMTDIVKVITTALAITTGFTLLILANMYAPKICKKAAGLPMMVASLVLWIVWTYSPAAVRAPFQAAFGKQLIYVEWLVCAIIFVLCALFGKEQAGNLVPQEND